MTDNEIIKALKEHIERTETIKYGVKKITYVNAELLKDTLDLINRQQAEIERLQKENNQFADIGKMYSEIKTEAIKEFAERLKKAKQYSIERHENIVPVAVIDWIVKEI